LTSVASQSAATRRALAGAAAIMMATFVASRATGLIREVVVSARFGTSPEMASYLAAIQIPDLIFQVTAGGAVASAFIPVFAGYLAREERADGWRMVNTLFTLAAVVLLPLSLLIVLLAPQIMSLFVPDFTPEYRQLAGELSRILMIGPLFFTFGCFATSVLNTHQRFLLAALAPTSYNLGIIVGAVALAPRFGIRGLALGAALGSILFFLVQVPGLIQVGMRYQPLLDLRHRGARQVGRLMIPRTIGLAVAQVNFIVTVYLAQSVPASVSALNWAWTLTNLPLGVFAMAIAQAVFPSLSTLVARDERVEVRRTVSQALRYILYLMIPATIGLIFISSSVVRVVFERGRFTAESTAMVAHALQFYALGLVGMGAVEILTRTFYANHDTRTPTAIAAAAMLVNVTLASILVRVLSFGGLALSMAIASTLQAVALSFFAHLRLPGLFSYEVVASASRAIIAAVPLAVAVHWATTALTPIADSGGLAIQAAALLATIAFGGVIYLAGTFVLGAEEFGQIRRLFVRQDRGGAA
jgi:putative peptidoglycan lipid II flippase